MANPEHLAILRQGVEEWNEWRDQYPDVPPDLAGASLIAADVSAADLSDADLGMADLCGAFLVGANLVRANLHEADLRAAYLRGANLQGAKLVSANLSEAKLREANLVAANLSGAKLSAADLRFAILNEANLVAANLSESDLGWAGLVAADLRQARLSKAYLVGANLRVADLSGADLAEARVGGTNFGDVDLSTAKGLETVHHAGPSTIGVDTIYKSRGKIPEVFLRGCGVPDEFIAYIGSMVGRPIEYYSCFISYSTKDQDFADRLYADLQAKGVRCWFAPHDIQGGRKIQEQIDDAIRLHDKLLLILSEHSMSSNWVKTEIANARQREDQEKKNLLFPITLAAMEEVKKWKLFDADRGIDSAREVREYYIPDFSRWKEHDSYQAALAGLVRDLKAVGSG